MNGNAASFAQKLTGADFPSSSLEDWQTTDLIEQRPNNHFRTELTFQP
jgi:hypothetical protein